MNRAMVCVRCRHPRSLHSPAGEGPCKAGNCQAGPDNGPCPGFVAPEVFTSEDIAAARTHLRGECTCEFTQVGPGLYVRPVIDPHCPVHAPRSEPDVGGNVWPWRQLDELSDRLYWFMRGAVMQVMLAAGEDTSNKALVNLRCVQVTYGLNSRAERERGRVS